MKFSEAKLEHKDVIVNFQLAMAMETEDLHLDKEVLTKGVEAVMSYTSKGKYYIVKEDEKVVASLMITFEWSDWRCRNVWWIQSVYVIPEMRGKGIFSLMYENLKKEVMTKDDVAGLRLYVDNSNRNAQKVYAKVGMTDEHYIMYEWMKDF